MIDMTTDSSIQALHARTANRRVDQPTEKRIPNGRAHTNLMTPGVPKSLTRSGASKRGASLVAPGEPARPVSLRRV